MHRAHRVRFLTIACISTLYVALLIQDALNTFNASSFLEASIRFGFSGLVSLIFLAIGALVWLYACNRLVALVHFGFSVAMAFTFAVETGAQSGNFVLSTITSVSSPVALAFLATLFLLFPRNLLSWRQEAAPPGGRPRSFALVMTLRTYLCVLLLLGTVVSGATVPYFLGEMPLASLLPLFVYCYGFLGLTGSLFSLWISYRSAATLREQQQFRLLVGGCLLALVPFLVLTLLPLLINLPETLVVNSQISTATMVVLPLVLGYAIVRYQLLIFEAHIRRFVTRLVGLLCLAVLAYLLISISYLLSTNVPEQVGFIVIALSVLGSFTWRGVKSATERVFFSEIRFYRRLLAHPERLLRETFDLGEASWLIVAAAVEAFEPSTACLFILDDESGCYRPYFPLKEIRQASQRLIEEHVFGRAKPATVSGRATDWVDVHDPVFSRLSSASRPLLLSELRGEWAGLPRLLLNTQGGEADPLLAPIRVNSRMVGALVLGVRGDRQAYAGTDFEVIDLILTRFGPILEVARLYALGSSYAALVMKFYTGLPRKSIDQFKTLEDVARGYAKVAASATSTAAEVWLVDTLEREHILRRLFHLGAGPPFSGQDHLRLEDVPGDARYPTFATRYRTPGWLGSEASAEEAHAAAAPTGTGEGREPLPFAWLPLVCDGQLHGVLVLTYARPHAFVEKEQRLLEWFASQCATAIENARITLELGAAYQHDLALDRQRDQFLMAAFQELRVPVTTVQGYIELVCDYGTRLSLEGREELLARAQYGSGELVLMVNTIMDAILPHAEGDLLPLRQIALLEVISEVVSMRESALQSQQRAVRIEVPPTLFAQADALRLRQVVLTLLNNALAYSPEGSGIEIQARQEGENVTIRVRDYGEGIPPDILQRLFTPFARPEAEKSGPLRGAGLGLYVSKQLVEAMGGHIWGENAGPEEKGSVFAFTLRLTSSERIAQA